MVKFLQTTGQVVMSTSAGLTGISGQQIMTHLVPSQTQVVHQASAPVGVTTTIASAIPQAQVGFYCMRFAAVCGGGGEKLVTVVE